jgi:hypothetical protein
MRTHPVERRAKNRVRTLEFERAYNLSCALSKKKQTCGHIASYALASNFVVTPHRPALPLQPRRGFEQNFRDNGRVPATARLMVRCMRPNENKLSDRERERALLSLHPS